MSVFYENWNNEGTSVGVGYQADNIWLIKAILILLSNVLC